LFKPQPTWFDDGSDFRRAIEADVPGIEWRPFPWSGENSEIERRKAAEKFADALRRELDVAPESCHVVIAHSHGGNVALWGLGHLDETRLKQVAGLATMGTPFLHFAPRSLSALESFYLRLIVGGKLILLAILVLPLAVLQLAFEGRLDLNTVAAAVIGVAGSIASYVSWRKQELLTRELEQYRPIWPERLASFVALRSRGDEASRVIAVADAAGRSLASAWSIVRLCTKLMPWDDRAWRRKVLRVALMVLGALTGVMWTQAAIAPFRFRAFLDELFPAGVQDWQAWLGLVILGPLTLALLLVFIVLWSVAVLPMTLALPIVLYSQFFFGLAFGVDTFGLAIVTEIAAEPNPPRPAPVIEHVEPGDADTRHSIHAMSAARTRLAAWIRERQAAGRPASAGAGLDV
jgi:hypothetical protein